MNEVARITATTEPQYKLLCKHLPHRVNLEQTIENHYYFKLIIIIITFKLTIIFISNLLLFQLHIALLPQLQYLQFLQRIFSGSAGQRAVQMLHSESILKTVSLNLSQLAKRWDNGSARGQKRVSGTGKKKRGKFNQSESAHLPQQASVPYSAEGFGLWPMFVGPRRKFSDL